MPLKIAVYRGKGTCYQGLIQPDLSLSARELIHSEWEKETSLLIMPGGRDCLYHAVLQGAGNRKIRSFVEQGGVYLGLCAGAYYGCRFIEFDKGYPLEVCGERELQFFSGTAVGPAYGKGTFAYEGQADVRAAALTALKGALEGIGHAYYKGGCFFQGDFSSCKILARYAELPGAPPAIIECSIGKGKAILSGVHLELNGESLESEDLRSLLRQSENARISFWNQYIMPIAREPSRQSDGSGDGKSSAPHRDRCS